MRKMSLFIAVIMIITMLTGCNLNTGILNSNTQKEAIKTAVNGQVSIITGGPGTGKTTIVKCILQSLKKYSNKIFLLAPTGRASKRLSEACSHNASTIHRALEVSFKEGDNSFFNYNEKNKLVIFVIVVFLIIGGVFLSGKLKISNSIGVN